MVKITIEDNYGACIVEDKKDDLNIYEIMDLIERALLANSYDLETIKDGFISKASDHEETK